MNRLFIFKKDSLGYVMHKNGKMLDATYKDLKEKPEMRTELVESIYQENRILRKQIEAINETLEPDHKVKPRLQVNKIASGAYEVKCVTGNLEYVGTIVSPKDLREGYSLAIKFIELLHEDHTQLEHLIIHLSEVEERALAACSQE